MLRKMLAFAGLVATSMLLWVPSAFAESPSVVTALDNDFTTKKFIAVAAGFGIAIAAFGGALAQGRAVAATLEGISRNPGAAGKMFVPMILGLALIESLVIYALVIAFSLIGKLG
jgi:F-type H+-transporting ATPase subunit c